MSKADAPILDHIKSLIKDNKVIVFGRQGCAYTKKAREALVKPLTESTIYYYDIEKEPDVNGLTEKYKKVLAKMTGTGATVPKVFIGGQFIGGGDETVEAVASGEVREMAEEAGVKVRNYCKKTSPDADARLSKHVENLNNGSNDQHINRNHNKSATHTGSHVSGYNRAGKVH